MSDQTLYPPGMPGLVGEPGPLGFPGLSDIVPTYGIVTFILVDEYKERTVTRMIETKYTREVIEFLKKNNSELALGEFEQFYEKLKNSRHYKVIAVLKNIIKEINDGRITVRGNKNAKKRV